MRRGKQKRARGIYIINQSINQNGQLSLCQIRHQYTVNTARKINTKANKTFDDDDTKLLYLSIIYLGTNPHLMS